jgi:predicted TIM-barrel fold metal-dependent hydrolase
VEVTVAQPSERDSSWGFPIIDFHCHFPVPDPDRPPAEVEYEQTHGAHKLQVLRDNWRWYQEQWWTAYGFPFPEDVEPPADVQARRWSDEIEHARLTTAVFLTGGGNDALSAAIEEHPRMLGFAHHDPFMADAAGELRRAVNDLGLVGYKVIAPALSGRIDDPVLWPVWQVAEDLGIPVLVHFGVLDGGGGTAAHVNMSPLRLHDVAKAFPEVPFVVPHFGCGYPGDLLQLAWACRNVYVDSSGNNEWIRWMPYPLTLADLFRKFLDTLGPQRVVFGSDSAHFPRGLVRAYYDEQCRVVKELGLTAEDRDLVFAGNAARLLRLVG